MSKPRSRAISRGRLTRAAVLVVLCAAAASACDTPVYQYTIENWRRDAYLVRYFHKGSEAPADAKVNDYLTRVSSGQVENANLSFARVNVTDAAALSSPVHRRVWERHSSRPTPFHVIVSPKGHEVFAGRLTEPDARALVSSPGRTRLAEALARGTHGALLLVTGPRTDENRAGREALARVVEATIREGREVGSVEVARDAAAERWLIRQVLLLESDLPELDNAMVFPVFGRGHVLEPYLGKGITARNLTEVVEFMNGPCACEVKSASIGMDLLTNFDWTKRQVAGGAATAPSFALVNIREEEPSEPVVVMPTAPTRTATRPARNEPKPDPAPRSATTTPPRTQPTAPAAKAEQDEPGGAEVEPADDAGGGDDPPVDNIPIAAAESEDEGFGDPMPDPVFPEAPAAEFEAAGEPFPASDERALASGPDLVAASRPVPADLATAEGTPGLAAQLPLALGLLIAGGTLAVLLAGMFLVLRPKRE